MHHRAAGVRTFSGLKDSNFDAFLYKRRIIFREIVGTGAPTALAVEVETNLTATCGLQRGEEQKLLAAAVHQTEARMSMKNTSCGAVTWGPYNADYATTRA
ncbi:hypothetical protein FN846DRAFT_893359 [Sphaerosporella brunnea]|uniref:Uncharacterized protein n=1 Tax=Sphaerosporella brunnea TaxID=1250544 RepID=A0A5J5EL01_9PEZI|nr:hypothetical protein FN846DRAFT_893359 [Sphaerosporella brunnea]